MAGKPRRRAVGAIGQGIRLAIDPASPAAELKWIQCCKSGTYLGHPKFAKIEWDAAVFQTIVDNLHKHPNFVAGADGVGTARVIPWDYEHANEIRAMNGDVPEGGLPAASWTYDLKAVKGAEGDELWALTEWLPRAREQILAGEYQGCSVCVLPSYIDPVSGLDQGPTMTSIAFTNQPFIQGMAPLAATLEQYGPAESPLEVLVGVRSALELPEDAPIPVVVENLDRLFAAIANGTVPEYVEESYILDRIRRLLKLPLLSTPEEILGGAQAALNSLPTEGATAPVNTPEVFPMAATLAALTAITAIFGCANEDTAIIQAAQAAKAKADESAKTEVALEGLDKLKQMFGADDLEGTLAAATKAIADAEAMKPAVAALSEACKALRSGATADAEAEAGAVAASMAAAAGNPTLKDRLYPAILQARSNCIVEVKPEGSPLVTSVKVDEAKLAKFRTDYPLPEEHRALLTRTIVAGPNGTQLGGPVTGYATQPITQTAGQQGSGDPEAAKVVDAINGQPGRNLIEKTNAYLCSIRPSHQTLDFATQCRISGQFSNALITTGKVPKGI
jgi:hypothetical protein